MDAEDLQKIKCTLLVILKERKQPREIALLAMVNRWEPEPVESNDSYEQNQLWELRLYLPAEAYARFDSEFFSETGKVVRSTLNEVVRSRKDRFVSLEFFPELVDQLTFTQDELVKWLEENSLITA